MSDKQADILIVDDHWVISYGIKAYLDRTEQFNIVDAAASGEEALKKIEKWQYDLIILDLSLGNMSGLDLLKKITASHTEIKTLIFTGHSETNIAERVFKMGAAGFLNKGSAMEELQSAIEIIMNGEKYLSHSLAKSLALKSIKCGNTSCHSHLSDREFQVMLMIARGKTNRHMAETLDLSTKTIETYRQRMMEKMSFTSNAEVVNYVVTEDLMLETD